MTKEMAIEIIDAYKNRLLDPVEMLNWTWLRVIIKHLDDSAWSNAIDKATETLSK